MRLLLKLSLSFSCVFVLKLSFIMCRFMCVCTEVIVNHVCLTNQSWEERQQVGTAADIRYHTL